MTARQEAHGLIDRMPEECIQALIPVMTRLIPFKKKQEQKRENEASPKMQAFLEMQEMRKTAVKYDISSAQREVGMAEKYGEIEWGTHE